GTAQQPSTTPQGKGICGWSKCLTSIASKIVALCQCAKKLKRYSPAPLPPVPLP
ncbi:hypothetical protein BaRGS_00014198, partial [Batillaria attramentaria]